MKKGKQKYRPKYRQKEDPESNQQSEHQDVNSNTLVKPKVEQHKHKPLNNLPKPRTYIEKQQSSQHSDDSCIICSEIMKNRQSVWSCRQCFKYMHLKCIQTWITNCNKDFKKTNILNWSCPQCKYEYSEQMPEYYCFCGKYKNPQYDREIPPHTCGNFCEKKRGPNCVHLCPLRCHKGKCPPCNFEGIQIKCCCGKEKMKIKCSDELSHFVCNNKCEKLLSCKKHKCAKACHQGPCNPCAFKHMATCHCGKNDDVIDCELESYSCESKCQKLLDCGNHKCEALCHAGNCQPCLRKPEIAKKCPCGQFDLMMLMNEPRKVCTDPIAVCGMPCKKKLSCGHNCTKSCHEGPCSKCKVTVTQTCSCTSSSRKAECWMLFDPNQKFECQKVCKKRKSCGIHQCQVVCCSYKFSNIPADHQCAVVCQKQLNCKKHTCDMPCHAGNCGNCPVLYSQPIHCPCGKTSLRPPISCGTLAPECDNLCLKQMPCGHICKLTCHYGPCQCGEKVLVRCQCEKNSIETDCGRSALCTQKCTQTLPCGHICQLQCHKPPCPTSQCQKICRKIRSCGHVCLQRCHPNSQCTNYPCQTEILIKCQCGHRQKMVSCGSTDILLQKHITCNKTCESIKRFKILYSGKDVYYPSNLVYFGLKNYNYLQKLEDSIEKYIRSEKENPLHIEFKFGYDQQIKMSMQILFQKHYHLDSYFSPHKKSPFFTILKTKNTMIPSPNLSHYINLVGKGEIKKNNIPFQASLKFASMAKDKSDTLEGYLQQYQHKYYPERKEKAFYLHFWLAEHAENAFDLLIQKYPNYPCALDLHNENVPKEEQVDPSQVIAEQALQKTQKPQIPIEKKEEKEKEKQTTLTAQEIEKQKAQVQEIKKIFIKPTILKKVYPPSSDLVQTIYKLDDEELNDEDVDWQKYGDELAEKQLGIEASEWRIRAFVIIRGVYGISKPTWLTPCFNKLIALYNQQKTKARRLLSHRSFDIKSAEDFLDQNDIYLSAHEPEITAYYILNKYSNHQVIQEFYEQLQKSPEVTRAKKVVEDLTDENFPQFFQTLQESQFTVCCSLQPLRQEAIKTSINNLITKGKKFQLKKVWQNLMFDSEEQFQKYISSLGYHLQVKPSKKQNNTAVYHVLVKNQNPTESEYKFKAGSWILEKRDVKYSNDEPEELYKEQYCLLSYFTFGDHKFQNNSYVNRLIKALKR